MIIELGNIILWLFLHEAIDLLCLFLGKVPEKEVGSLAT